MSDFVFIPLKAEKKWSYPVGDSKCPSDNEIHSFGMSDIAFDGDIRLRRVKYFPSENVKKTAARIIFKYASWQKRKDYIFVGDSASMSRGELSSDNNFC